MLWLKQSTAVTLKIGPFLDEDDGKTAETALTIAQADVRLSKNGGNIAQKNEATSCTHDELGIYGCPIDATDTATLGTLQLFVHESGALPVWHEFMVVPANVWDSMFGADYLQVDAVQISGDSTAADNAELAYDGTGYGFTGCTMPTVTTLTGHTAQTGDNFARLGAPAGASVSADVAAIKAETALVVADTNELQTDDVPGLIAALNDPTAAAIADAVWDEVLTAATHDVGYSAGQRLRLLILSGATAQAGSTANTIVLAATESATDNIFNENIVSIVSGTGAGQTRQITKYVGATKVATIDRDWEVTPDNTSIYEILPFNGLFLTGSGLVVAAAASTITLDATASATDNVYNGSVAVITAGTAAGQARVITAYNGTTKVATITPAWATNPDTTSVYKIIPVGRTIVDSFTDGAINAAAIATGTITADAIADDAIDAGAIATDAITSAQLAATATAEIADAVWDEAAAGHVAAGSFGAQCGTDIDAILADTGTDGVVVASINNDAITAASIAASAIGASEIGSGAIDADAIADNAIDAAAIAANAITAAKIATDAITSDEIAASGANKIADHVIRRTFQNACDSSDGDAKTGRSLLGAIAKLVNKISISGSTLTITEDDDTTSLFTQAVTTNASADPITALDTS
jgi:hypothetical protein